MADQREAQWKAEDEKREKDLEDAKDADRSDRTKSQVLLSGEIRKKDQDKLEKAALDKDKALKAEGQAPLTGDDTSKRIPLNSNLTTDQVRLQPPSPQAEQRKLSSPVTANQSPQPAVDSTFVCGTPPNQYRCSETAGRALDPSSQKYVDDQNAKWQDLKAARDAKEAVEQASKKTTVDANKAAEALEKQQKENRDDTRENQERNERAAKHPETYSQQEWKAVTTSAFGTDYRCVQTAEGGKRWTEECLFERRCTTKDWGRDPCESWRNTGQCRNGYCR